MGKIQEAKEKYKTMSDDDLGSELFKEEVLEKHCRDKKEQFEQEMHLHYKLQWHLMAEMNIRSKRNGKDS